MDKPMNIKVDENTQMISNLDEILAALNSIDNDLNTNEYLETLLNYLEFEDIKNKDVLIEAIKAKLLEFKALSEQELSSQEALRQAQEYNEDLKRINVISTNKYNNDSKKDIEYISITHEDGSVEMLVCAGNSSIGEYIAQDANDVATKSADEIFKYFKETVHNELTFYKEQEFEDLNPNLAGKAVVREDDYKKLEIEELRKYAHKNNLDEKSIRTTVDPNGERIYLVGSAIIKFHTDYRGERIMDILQQPVVSKSNDYDDLLSELDSEPISQQTDIFSEHEKEKESEEVGAPKPTETDEFEEIDFERIFPEFDLKRLKSLIIQKEVYNMELSADELTYINRSIAFLIGSMLERAENHELASEEELTLRDYMTEIVNKYDAIERGAMDPEELSETDKKLSEQYLENLDKIKALGLDKKPKQLELKDNNQSSGLAYAVILIEMLVIALFVLIFLSIDI